MTSLRQLEYLVTVVDTGSFTRAAEQLHVTQPALSHQMRALERGLGGPLLERLPRAVRLTPMGRAMLPHARAALADAERARCAARLASGTTAGELQVATVYSMSLGVLPPALRVWRRDRPGVDVRLLEFRHADELRDAMAAGEADVALGPCPADWTGPVRELGTEEFVVVLPSDGASEDDTTGEVDLATLADCAWVHYAPGNGLAELVDAACAAAGFRPRAAVRTEQTAAAPILAAAGLGPALVPANVLPVGFEGRVLRPGVPVRRTLAAYTRAAPDPLTAAFIETLVEHATVS
ncbi:LysR family transcriptional regulator [Amycolatopsis vancoresmycina]|uniref:LysR family transcriptional regulator n=1 Tax=Amycolatopsis vancoresmycina DSM 44592 TaxID=1292037 RepID=R1HZW9_9PSEU|nr:LysR family transcriptional regulator [Amycolatopsis vancoresmycina]EOD69030.1 LysR family transcriptional regulator [Amycolatopsis vancoresmycina DSM 44592]